LGKRQSFSGQEHEQFLLFHSCGDEHSKAGPQMHWQDSLSTTQGGGQLKSGEHEQPHKFSLNILGNRQSSLIHEQLHS
jgi:hypothetical protein